tara:strand:- start:630 stop:1001 length:372 start_codon:yes stop_codon:yes gene_type:complete
VVTPGGSDFYLLTHYITSAPNFEHILLVKSVSPIPTSGVPTSSWPMRVTFQGYKDVFGEKLKESSAYTAHGEVLSSSGTTSTNVKFNIYTGVEIYAGTDDGYSSYAENCPIAPPHPQARGLCP